MEVVLRQLRLRCLFIIVMMFSYQVGLRAAEVELDDITMQIIDSDDVGEHINELSLPSDIQMIINTVEPAEDSSDHEKEDGDTEQSSDDSSHDKYEESSVESDDDEKKTESVDTSEESEELHDSESIEEPEELHDSEFIEEPQEPESTEDSDGDHEAESLEEPDTSEDPDHT